MDVITDEGMSVDDSKTAQIERTADSLPEPAKKTDSEMYQVHEPPAKLVLTPRVRVSPYLLPPITRRPVVEPATARIYHPSPARPTPRLTLAKPYHDAPYRETRIDEPYALRAARAVKAERAHAREMRARYRVIYALSCYKQDYRCLLIKSLNHSRKIQQKLEYDRKHRPLLHNFNL
jgi:hypothetical protein